MKNLTCLFLLFGLFSCNTKDPKETPKETDANQIIPIHYNVHDYLCQEMADMNDYNAMGDLKHPILSRRQIFDIKINSEDEVIVREELLFNTDDLSERIHEFYLMNAKLTKFQLQSVHENPSARGYDYPGYSSIGYVN